HPVADSDVFARHEFTADCAADVPGMELADVAAADEADDRYGHVGTLALRFTGIFGDHGGSCRTDRCLPTYCPCGLRITSRVSERNRGRLRKKSPGGASVIFRERPLSCPRSALRPMSGGPPTELREAHPQPPPFCPVRSSVL